MRAAAVTSQLNPGPRPIGPVQASFPQARRSRGRCGVDSINVMRRYVLGCDAADVRPYRDAQTGWRVVLIRDHCVARDNSCVVTKSYRNVTIVPRSEVGPPYLSRLAQQRSAIPDRSTVDVPVRDGGADL